MKQDKRFNLRRRQALGMLGVMSLSPVVIAADAAFPSKPIRLILPFSAGSSTDFISRLVADQLGKQVKQSVIVDNKPGAGGAIGTVELARSNPDGYTIGLVSLATLALAPPTQKEPQYDSVRDFAPLSALVSTDLILVAGPRASGNTLAEFVNWAQKQKDPLFFGTLGSGTSGHFAGFLFAQAAKIKLEPVHFKTFSELLPAMLSSSIDFTIIAPSQIVPFVKEGKLRGLALNGPSRMTSLPAVPTFGEAGYPDMQFMNWIGLAAPAKTPPEILDKLSAEIIKAASTPTVRAKLEDGGFRVVANKREEFAALIRKDVVLWRDMVKTTGFKV